MRLSASLVICSGVEAGTMKGVRGGMALVNVMVGAMEANPGKGARHDWERSEDPEDTGAEGADALGRRLTVCLATLSSAAMALRRRPPRFLPSFCFFPVCPAASLQSPSVSVLSKAYSSEAARLRRLFAALLARFLARRSARAASSAGLRGGQVVEVDEHSEQTVVGDVQANEEALDA